MMWSFVWDTSTRPECCNQSPGSTLCQPRCRWLLVRTFRIHTSRLRRSIHRDDALSFYSFRRLQPFLTKRPWSTNAIIKHKDLSRATFPCHTFGSAKTLLFWTSLDFGWLEKLWRLVKWSNSAFSVDNQCKLKLWNLSMEKFRQKNAHVGSV